MGLWYKIKLSKYRLDVVTRMTSTYAWRDYFGALALWGNVTNQLGMSDHFYAKRSNFTMMA
jgi:hypothetical protein